MLHTYRKTATIQAERFDGSIKQITRYKVHIVGPTSRGDTCMIQRKCRYTKNNWR